jgi:hypothetical protein
MKDLKKYSVELLASLISESALFEESDYETWDDKMIEFDNCEAFISGVMFSHEEHEVTRFYAADISNVLLVFDDEQETIFTTDEIIELERLVKLYKI